MGGKSKDETIRIFVRLRPPATEQQSALLSVVSAENEPFEYEVEHELEGSLLKLRAPRADAPETVNNSKEEHSFSFQRVLEPGVTQEQVFNVVAKECVESVLDGYNSTVFAYGQTGSGKTFSTMGGIPYEDRGIIPRALQMVYREIGRRTDTDWSVDVSFLQIYNEKGQDLLNRGREATKMEDLPVVTISEDGTKETLKNLAQHRPSTIRDALDLLNLGDTNRLYSETPMNKSSSRSHCIFMITLTGRNLFAQRVAMIRQNAKVNEVMNPDVLVKTLRAEVAQLKDRLAFAEQSGGASDRQLNEDERHMCELMTSAYLRSTDPEARIEGFGGDLARIYFCFALMKKMITEGGFSTDGGGTKVDELTRHVQDYQEQIEALQISLQQKENEMTMLFDMLHKTNAPKYNASTQTLMAPPGAAPAGVGSWATNRAAPPSAPAPAPAPAPALVPVPAPPPAPSPSPAPRVPSATEVITAAAMAKVNTLAERGKLNEAQATAVTEFLKSSEEHQKSGISALTDAELLQNRAAALEVFKQSYKGYEKVEEMKGQLKAKIEACKATGREANAINDRIKHIKKEIMSMRAERAVGGVDEASTAEQALLDQLREEKQTLGTYIEKVKQQKEEIEGIESYLQRSKEKLAKSFEEWISVRQRQVQLAMQAMPATNKANAPTTGRENAPAHVAVSVPALTNSPQSPMLSTPPTWHPSSAPSSTTGTGLRTLPEQFAATTNSLSSSQRVIGLSAAVPAGSAVGGGWVGGDLSSSRQRAPNPYHLQPLTHSPNPGAAPATSSFPIANASPPMGSPVLDGGTNPYAPMHRTTAVPCSRGNAPEYESITGCKLGLSPNLSLDSISISLTLTMKLTNQL
eukprot:gene8465-5941_t